MDTNIGGSKAVFYAGYTYEDMNRYGFIFSSYSESHPNNLTGEIHPIFQPNNWYNLEFDDVMTPVLRLASNIIKSPNSRMFLYNVYYAERKLLEDLSKRIGREARQFERIRDVPYSEEVFPRTTMLLQRLTDYVRFTWFDPSDPNVSPYQVGYCGKNKHHRAWMSDGYEPTGYISRISLNLNMVRKLSQLRNSPRVCGSSSQILRLQFMMANSLCHELVHAFNNSITDKMGVPEPFFEDERIAELGHAWDSAVFGGTWYPIKDFLGTFPLLVVKWPSFERRATSASLERKPPYKFQTKYFIPMDWIARIQQQEEWETQDQWEILQCKEPQYEAALSRIIALLKIPYDRGFKEQYPFDDFDPNWESEDSSNKKFPMNAAGHVFREPLLPEGGAGGATMEVDDSDMDIT